jgi:hypothetical protein
VRFEPTAIDVCPHSGLLAVAGRGIVTTWRLVEAAGGAAELSWVGAGPSPAPTVAPASSHPTR